MANQIEEKVLGHPETERYHVKRAFDSVLVSNEAEREVDPVRGPRSCGPARFTYFVAKRKLVERAYLVLQDGQLAYA